MEPGFMSGNFTVQHGKVKSRKSDFIFGLQYFPFGRRLISVKGYRPVNTGFGFCMAGTETEVFLVRLDKTERLNLVNIHKNFQTTKLILTKLLKIWYNINIFGGNV